MTIDIFYHFSETDKRFGSLRVEISIFGEVQLFSVIKIFDDNGMAFGLPNQSKYFGMTILAIDHNLTIGIIIFKFEILLLDALLEMEHNGTSGIDDIDM